MDEEIINEAMRLPPIRIAPEVQARLNELMHTNPGLANLDGPTVPEAPFDLDASLYPLEGPYTYQSFESTESDERWRQWHEDFAHRFDEMWREGLSPRGLSGLIVPYNEHVTYVEAEYRVERSTTEEAREWASEVYHQLLQEALFKRAMRALA